MLKFYKFCSWLLPHGVLIEQPCSVKYVFCWCTAHNKCCKEENFLRLYQHKAHYSLENFGGVSGRGHHVRYTANDSREKLSRLAKKLQKFSPSKHCLLCMVCNARWYVITDYSYASHYKCTNIN